MKALISKLIGVATVSGILIAASGCNNQEPPAPESTPEPQATVEAQAEPEPTQEPDPFDDEESDIDFEALRNVYRDTQGFYDKTPYELIDVLTTSYIDEKLDTVSYLLKEGEGYPAKYYVYSFHFDDGYTTDTLQEISNSWLITDDMASSRIVNVPHGPGMDVIQIIAGEGNDHPVEISVELPETVMYKDKEYKIYPKGILSLDGIKDTIICGAKATDKENRVFVLTKENDEYTVQSLDMIGYVWPSVMEALNATDSGCFD